jgi:hypothetical protein
MGPSALMVSVAGQVVEVAVEVAASTELGRCDLQQAEKTSQLQATTEIGWLKWKTVLGA